MERGDHPKRDGESVDQRGRKKNTKKKEKKEQNGKEERVKRKEVTYLGAASGILHTPPRRLHTHMYTCTQPGDSGTRRAAAETNQKQKQQRRGLPKPTGIP